MFTNDPGGNAGTATEKPEDEQATNEAVAEKEIDDAEFEDENEDENEEGGEG